MSILDGILITKRYKEAARKLFLNFFNVLDRFSDQISIFLYLAQFSSSCFFFTTY